MLNLCLHLMKSLKNTSERLVVIPDVLNYKDETYLKFNNNCPIISDQLLREIIFFEPSTYQNKASLNAVITSTNHLMPTCWFSRRVSNENEGTEVNRSRLLYLPKNNAAYCFCCLLFSTPNFTT